MEFVRLLNRKRGNLRGQLTKLANAFAEETPTDPAELQAQLDFIVKLQEKFELLKEEYYRVVTEEEFEDIEISLAEMDDEIQKIEVSLKTSIYKLNPCNFSVSSDCSNDNNRPKKASIKLPEIPLPIFNGKFEEWNIFKGQFKT
ncbi:DUF1758 domain-containing protein [Trichonephila clavata]|uniref:DUF1758 domain-containing protein n=1 Tax=Trichonephila clavata TaxID=2740835 RepID=A0A8X6IAN6_TRICU|nr:DUF1758 domain-containing protein [Trichonephila clavata]